MPTRKSVRAKEMSRLISRDPISALILNKQNADSVFALFFACDTPS